MCMTWLGHSCKSLITAHGLHGALQVNDLTMLHASSWGVPATPWAQGGPRSDTRDLCRHWRKGPIDPSVGETPSIGNASELWVADGVMILECSTTPQVEVWAWRYDNLSGALPMDNALGQKWHKSHARDCLGWNMHNFLGICPNGASEGSIGIYRHSRCHLSGCLLDLHNKCKSYGGLKLLGDYTSTAKGNCYLMVG